VDRHDPAVKTAVVTRSDGDAGDCDGKNEKDNQRPRAHPDPPLNHSSLITHRESLILEPLNR
jgi:hypothetical protein